MDVAIPGAEARSGNRRAWFAAVLLSLGFLAGAWILAQWPPIKPAESAEWIWHRPIGQTVLIVGGLPWVVQWAGLAILTVSVARGWLRVNWRAVLLGVLFPLCVGLIWWIGFCATFWQTGRIEVLLEATCYSFLGHHRTVSQMALFEVFGPLTYPLQQRGPVNLEGWEFLWTGLSTALVMSTLTWVARTRKVDTSGSARITRGQLVLMLIWILLYVGPVYVRASIRIVDVLMRAATTGG